MNGDKGSLHQTWAGTGGAGSRMGGVTLVELMVTVAVLAIMTAIAYPSFNDVLRSNRVSTATNELVASLALARSEAIRSARPTGVCASKDGSACNGSWNDGLMVWEDRNGNGKLDAGEEVVRFAALTGRFTVTGPDRVRFDGRGRSAMGQNALALQPADCREGKPHRRVLHVSATGQLRTEKLECK